MDNGAIYRNAVFTYYLIMTPNSKPIVCLAPMDGITDMAYRRIVRKFNPNVVLYSEFTSINGIEHSDVVRSRLDYHKEELPYIVQLFGNEPELFARTVQQFSDSGISGIDINMGCPAKKIVKSNNGGSLMKDVDLACRLVDACCRGTDLPISVKTRLGWNDAENLVTFVKALNDAGASMISVHGRTYKQRFKGEANWEPIYELKRQIDVPLIGNGDLKSKEEADDKLMNLDGYMIGRAAIGNPWVFWAQENRDRISLRDRTDAMIHHFQLLREYKNEKKSLIEFRKHVSGYISGFQDAKYYRSVLMRSTSEKEFVENAMSIA